MSPKIRIKLKSYDHNLVDKSAERIVKTVKETGAVVRLEFDSNFWTHLCNLRLTIYFYVL